jgi:hypothetical protein
MLTVPDGERRTYGFSHGRPAQSDFQAWFYMIDIIPNQTWSFYG